MRHRIKTMMSNFWSNTEDVAHASRCPVLSPTSRCRVSSNQAVLSLFALRRTTGFDMDNYDVVSHTGSRQDHVSVKHFGVEGQLVFRVAYQVVRPPRFLHGRLC